MSDWLDTLPSVSDWAGNLAQPYDDTPGFDQQENPEIDTMLRLKGDRSLIRRPTRRLFIDYRSQPDAYAHLETMPDEGETAHLIISGQYALYEVIPALIERTGKKIRHLYVATLSFNDKNAFDLLDLFETGHVQRISLLISYYFKSTSRKTYDLLIPKLREHGQKVLAMRTHMKILLAEMEDGTKYTFAGSPNLRSSVNVENLDFTRGPELHDWYRGIFEELFATQSDLGAD